MKFSIMMALCGAAAGAVNGLLGAGGGMILVPLLVSLTDIDESAIFSTSVTIILPICVISLLLTQSGADINWREALLVDFLLENSEIKFQYCGSTEYWAD